MVCHMEIERGPLDRCEVEEANARGTTGHVRVQAMVAEDSECIVVMT